MHPYILVPLLSCVAAAGLAGAVLARSEGHRANRITAGILGASAFWSLTEVLLARETDPGRAVHLVRASALGWMSLGPLSFQLYLELSGSMNDRARRLLRLGAAFTAVSVLIYVTTPWGLARVVPTSFGFGFEFGALFPVLYLATVAYPATVLVLWRGLVPSQASPGERAQGRWIVVSIALPLAVASLTDVTLPALGVHVPRFGSASVTLLGAVIVFGVRRHGYSLLAPGVFARKILETLRDGVALLSLDGRIRNASAGLARLAGTSPDALRGRDVHGLLTAPPDALLRLDTRELECELVPEIDRRVPVSVSTAPLLDRRGDPIGLVLVARDLREVAGLRSHLVTSGRLAAVGELAAGIAHEINNPVAFVHANLNQLHRYLKRLAPVLGAGSSAHDAATLVAESEELVVESLEGIDRVAAIVRDIRGFSHAGRSERCVADPNGLVESTLRMAMPQLGKTVRVEKRLGEVPGIRCAPHEIQQVLLNLVLNARQAIDANGTIRVETALQDDTVVMSVIDDGCGIEPDLIERIFDPFFTTKGVGEGTGLGLAISYEIVRRHGGEIAVGSAVGRGSAFRVRLPVARPEEDDDPSEDGPEAPGPR